MGKIGILGRKRVPEVGREFLFYFSTLPKKRIMPPQVILSYLVLKPPCANHPEEGLRN
jgi:hypothetical protein